MQVFCHHLYEYKKGLRNLILHTTDKKYEKLIRKKLSKNNISYLIKPLNENKINIFFGNDVCIEVLTHFNKMKLNELSDEEDFILGIMLGYDRIQQCKRFLIRKIRKGEIDDLVG